MAKKKVTVRFEGSFTFEYDPNSEEFKDALQSYNECIGKGDEYTIFKQIAHHFASGRTINDMVEGVGYVIKKDTKAKHNPVNFSGVSIVDDDPFLEIEII